MGAPPPREGGLPHTPPALCHRSRPAPELPCVYLPHTPTAPANILPPPHIFRTRKVPGNCPSRAPSPTCTL